jgi:hypothetical protein
MPLVLTMMLGAALAALSAAMAIGTATETMIAGGYRDGTALFYAADAAAEFAIDELARSDWADTLDTGGRSTFVAGAPPRSGMSDGPAGYELYASGPFGDMLNRTTRAVDPYVIVWVADLTESSHATASERIAGIQATAFGAAGGRRSVALTARLTSFEEGVVVERLSWTQNP